MAITHEQSLENFSAQLDYTLGQYTPHGFRVEEFKNLVIGGLGGSGIGGRLTRLSFINDASIPVEVFSEYQLPAYADEFTLVILCSYSGSTEETLAMYDDAQSRGCKIICMTTGGELGDRAKRDGLKCYVIEPGFQPRMALGYGFGFQLLVLAELFGMDMKAELATISQRLKDEKEALKARATALFDFFRNTIHHKFVVVCDMAFEAAAIRFCQQIQENAKGEAFVNVLPEANHNVIESYYEQRDTNFILLNSGQNERTNLRFTFLKGVLADEQNRVFEFPVQHFSLWTLFEFIYITDWLSIYASNAKNVNNMEVGIIMRLKNFLTQS
jgi:glucose/mannose-6-phosphate isomerase